jgi:kynureninase
VDFAVGGFGQVLCGGPGAGYLYVRPDLVRDLRPRSSAGQATSSRSRSRPARFATPTASSDSRAARQNVPSLYSARGGYEIVGEIGVLRHSRAIAETHAPADSTPPNRAAGN